MTLPVNLTLITVSETFLAQSGTTTPIPLSGTVEFTPTGKIDINDPDNAIFRSATVIGTLDANGTFSVDLIPEDDTDISPNGWTYDVTEKLMLGTTPLQERTYSITVPSPGPVRLSSVAPTPPSSGSTIYVLSVAGVEPGVGGDVPAASLRTALGAYVKPAGGIPETDLDTATQAKIDAAGASGTVTAVNGVSPDGLGHVVLTPTDISAASAAALSAEISRAEAAEAGLYTKPAGGIPKTDLATTVQTSLSSADTAVQPARQVIAGTGLAGGGSLAADRTISVVYGNTAGTSVQGNDPKFVGAEQTANKNVAGGYVGIDATTGRALPSKLPLVRQVVALTFAATLVIDASAGSLFRVTLTGPMTLAAPTNPTDGQTILVQLAQDATGGRVLTLDPVWNLGPLSMTLSTAANAVDYMIAQYRSAATKWDVLGVALGY